jgi:hypothetical protein
MARHCITRVVETASEALGREMSFVSGPGDGWMAFSVVSEAAVSLERDVDGPVEARADPGANARADPGAGAPTGQPTDANGATIHRLPARPPDAPDAWPTEPGAETPEVCVPVMLWDGRVAGALCCLAPRAARRAYAQVGLDVREMRMLKSLARLIGDQLEYERRQAALRSMQITDGTVIALMGSLEVRDGYTEKHSEAVAGTAVAITRRLGVHGQQLDDLRTAAALHDIGKLGVPDAILRKPGPLSREEWALMRRHPEIGAELVASMPPIAHLAPVIRAGHERWDGTGYPDRLAGEEIPLASRVIFIADAFQTMISDRPYSSRVPVEDARRELEANSGAQLWPEGVWAALEILATTSL